MAEPPELFRLKYAGHHHKSNTGSNTLQTEQFLVCRVTSRYNHRFSDRTSIPRTKASPEILQPQFFLQHRHSKDYKLVQTIITKPKFSKNSYTSHKCKTTEFKTAEEGNDSYNTSQKVYQASPSKVSLVKIIAGRRRIPLYGPARRQRAGPRQTSDLVLKTHT